MRIFLTGASGWIGSAVIPELHARGHQVIGLARSDASAARVVAAGAEVLRGDVQDLDVLRRGAERSDGVIHLAFRHDIAFTEDRDLAVASDRAAIETFADVLAGSDRPLAIASGVAGLSASGAGEPVTERDEPTPGPGLGGRGANELAALALAQRGVRAMSVRFAPTVHGDGDHGFIRMMVDADRAGGTAGYVGDGANRWAAVHRGDAARLVALGIERAPAGSVLHAVAEDGVRLRDIAEAIGDGLSLPPASLTPGQAEQQFGFLGAIAAMDVYASAALTRDLLGWAPSGPELIQDIAEGHYFRGDE